MSSTPCEHKNVAARVMDQTAGVECLDCGQLWYCWGDENHVPRELYNRAVDNPASGDGWVKCDLIPNACAFCPRNVV